MTQIKSAVFWAVTQNWKADGCQHFWNSYWSYLHNRNDHRQHKFNFPKYQHQSTFQCYKAAQKPREFLDLSPSNGDLTQQSRSERVSLSTYIHDNISQLQDTTKVVVITITITTTTAFVRNLGCYLTKNAVTRTHHLLQSGNVGDHTGIGT
jgi:hypothetical protein